MPTTPIWILGATGRIGRTAAAELAAEGHDLVLVGRSRDRLEQLGMADARLVAAPFADALDLIRRERDIVVLNTVGPFSSTTPALLPVLGQGAHAIDLANDLPAVREALGASAAAEARGATLVTGAGFGVLGTESALLTALEGRPTPERVRVDGIASIAGTDDVVGEALARTVVDGFGGPGKEIHGGERVRARFGGRAERLVTPDGDRVTTGSMPSGELLAAGAASGAAEVVAAASFAPTGPLAAVALPVLGAITRVPGARSFFVRRIAASRTKTAPMPRAHSWARAWASWADGTERTVWLRAGEGMGFTAAVSTEVARRLARGEGRRGAWTPGALFGAGLAEAAGATFFGG